MTANSSSTSLVRTPVYHQLNELLVGLLREGGYTAGSQFLTEREVAERFGISRITANKALSGLVSAGHLEFRKGVGTFVRGEALENDLRSLVSFTHHANKTGRKPVTKVLQFGKIPAKEAASDILAALDVAPDEPFLYMERLRLADGKPVILERRHMVASLCPGLGRREAGGSLYAWLESAGIKITSVEQRIRAVRLNEVDSELLEAKAGSAALCVRGVGKAGAPLWVEDTLYCGDRYEFHNSLSSGTPPRSARATLRTAD